MPASLRRHMNERALGASTINLVMQCLVFQVQAHIERQAIPSWRFSILHGQKDIAHACDTRRLQGCVHESCSFAFQTSMQSSGQKGNPSGDASAKLRRAEFTLCNEYFYSCSIPPPLSPPPPPPQRLNTYCCCCYYYYYYYCCYFFFYYFFF